METSSRDKLNVYTIQQQFSFKKTKKSHFNNINNKLQFIRVLMNMKMYELNKVKSQLINNFGI